MRRHRAAWLLVLTMLWGMLPGTVSAGEGPTAKLTVSVTVKALEEYWLEEEKVTLAEGENTALAALEAALEGSDLTQSGGENGYIQSMTKGGVTLSEMGMGQYSAWMYTVNGQMPMDTIGSCVLKEGDSVLVYYTDDFMRDFQSAGEGEGGEPEPDEGSGDGRTESETEGPGEPEGNAEKGSGTVCGFMDVSGHWGASWIRTAAEKRWLRGMSETVFAPEMKVSRGMFVTALYRMAGEPAVSESGSFSDVRNGAWYCDAVDWAATEGIAAGYNGRFAPERDVTREEAALMLYRYAGSPEAEQSGDLPGVSDYAQKAVQWAVATGYLQGYRGDLRPGDGTSRSEAAVLLCRMAGSENTTAEAGIGAKAAMEEACEWLLASVPEPGIGASGGEWSVIALCRAGYSGAETYLRRYEANAEKTIDECGGVLSQRKYTEYSRVILAYTALGKDPTKAAGYDLLLPLGDYEKTTFQGVNGAIWALLALDSGDYEVPINTEAITQATKQMYVEAVLDAQLPEGGWSLTAQSGEGIGEADLTAMALQALSDHSDQEAVSRAIERGLAYLSGIQEPDGGFLSEGMETAESTAQVLAALCKTGVSLTDPRFVKNGNTVLDGVLQFREADGGFVHTAVAEGDRIMATEQAVCALSLVTEQE